jgi:hypothetical protein
MTQENDSAKVKKMTLILPYQNFRRRWKCKKRNGLIVSGKYITCQVWDADIARWGGATQN